MNRNLHSPSTLTEFARDFEEEPGNLLTKIVNKISNAYNTSYNTVNDMPICAPHVNIVGNVNSISRSNSSSSLNMDNQIGMQSGLDEALLLHRSTILEDTDQAEHLSTEANEERTMVNVLKRISNIVAAKDNNLRNYRDTDLHRFWMPDTKAKSCYDCSQKFSTFRRKHHCRLCGQIFCSKCCSQVVPGKIIMCSGELKVCTYCSKIVLSYLKSPDITIDLKPDLQALQDDLSIKLSLNEENSENFLDPIESLHKKISVGYQEERFVLNQNPNLTNEDRKNILQHSNSIRTLCVDMKKVLPYQNCGTELIAYLITNQKSSNKMQAIAILNAMMAAGFLIPIVPDNDQIDFEETLHYKLMWNSDVMEQTTNKGHLSDLANDISGSLSANKYHLHDDYLENYPLKLIESSFSFQSLKNMEMENSIRSTTKLAKQLVKSYCQHEELLLCQLLRNDHLEQSWSNVLIPLCARIVNKFRHGFSINDVMDIRNYVNFKKLSGGSRIDSSIIDGVVFTKNVAHRDMPVKIQKPKILLLQCAIVYERVKGKFIRIETLLLQEKEYLRNVTARILNLKPNIVLVHKNVAGIAQDMLREFGITLVLDVKMTVLERLSRCLQCDIVTSIESNIGVPKLGSCDVFYVRNFYDNQGSFKTLMFFEINSSPRVFSFLLRGANNCELARVKKVAEILIYARYNWRLELAFLLDAFAQPPSHNTINNIENQNLSDVNALRCSNDQDSHENSFKKALSSTILSVSPFVTFPLPYLETEQGRKCILRQHFPMDLYFSKQLCATKEKTAYKDAAKFRIDGESKLKAYHPFVEHLITYPLEESSNVQNLLAEFRASGGRFFRTSEMFKLRPSQPIQKPHKIPDDCIYKDVLDLRYHQRLPVLFCSYYYNPKTTSSFCAQPTLLDMTYYGQHDIMLGEFLQRYCFRSYICQSCNLPMMDHVRRYVHSMGCVQVQLSEDATKNDTDTIFLTSWCTVCNEVTPSVPISQDTWCLSFAKYLELRFHGHVYKTRAANLSSNGIEIDLENLKCSHSLHKDYVHYFSSKGFGARFMYSPIDVWEINLPPLMINLPEPKSIDRIQIQEDIRQFSEKGNEVYLKIRSRISELGTEQYPIIAFLKSIVNRDQHIFRRHIENVYVLLTDQFTNSNDINDSLLKAKRALAESIELWGPRLHEVILQTNTFIKPEGFANIDSGTICTEDFVGEFDLKNAENKRFYETEVKGGVENIIEDVFAEHREKPVAKANWKQTFDKETIKQHLTQLLPSTSQINVLQSPFSPNEHYTLPFEEFPILVQDQDLSSIIAYCLSSMDYRKSIDNTQNTEFICDADNSPTSKRKSQDCLNDADDRDNSKLEDEKKIRSRAHQEIQFQDGATQFTCKIYFAKEFDAIRACMLDVSKGSTLEQLRKNVTSDSSQINQDIDKIRILFARSIQKSVQWDARGGKSGSKFTKTSDDRFILKEMTKGDVSIFESFAPYYFDYVRKCLHNNQPTLLAKIVGVFKVTIKKKDSLQEKSLLIMENLFYGCNIRNKFDLKGSERNRLVNPENENGEIVLLDENLINMSWSKPLYILSHSKIILREAINRDTSFLERNSVMDYSLLVGLNNDNNMLVLGIIDYIRTFTFDKRLESLVKQTGILGGQGKLPTVISPQRYKQRFTEAMERYFHSVPDRWEGLSKK